jgi:6-phosphogluconolactonase
VAGIVGSTPCGRNSVVTRPLFRSFDQLEDLHAAVELAVVGAAMNGLSARGKFHLVLAGGNTPRALYERLARRREAVDWGKVDFWWGDERCVDPESEDSNFKMANDAWLSRLSLAEDRLHRIRGELGPTQAAASYADEIRRCLGDAPCFDLVLLGMGSDGHSASLFPGHAADSSSFAMAVLNAPKPPPERVSLSESVLTAAQRRLFLVAGSDKRAAMAGLQAGGDAPASRIAWGGASEIFSCLGPGG